GRPVLRIDGRAKVTGKAAYGSDLIAQRADLFVAVVRSEYAHASLQGIDTSAAIRSPGVLGVYTSRDVKGTNRQGLIFRDQPVLATDKVMYRGDAVAIVTATSDAAAARAVKLVRIQYKQLQVIANI